MSKDTSNHPEMLIGLGILSAIAAISGSVTGTLVGMLLFAGAAYEYGLRKQ